jgi:hypothetical protein
MLGGGDCDDNDPAASPGTAEVFDCADNDCDGLVDEDGFNISVTFAGVEAGAVYHDCISYPEIAVDGDMLGVADVSLLIYKDGVLFSPVDETHLCVPGDYLMQVDVELCSGEVVSESVAFAIDLCALDIKPGGCPNPLNRISQGVLPVALLGTPILDIAGVDLATVRLARADGVGGSVAPLMGPPGAHPVLEDVGTPFPAEPCDCHDLLGDGIVDLSLKFSTPALLETLELGAVEAGAVVELVLHASLVDGTPLSASDCVRLTWPGDADMDGDVDESDFGHFQACLTSSGVCNTNLSCDHADLDGDCDIDLDDFGILEGCMSGPDVIPDSACDE